MAVACQIETLAFAYELHGEGCSWDFIAEIVGINSQTLRKSIYRIMRDGIKKAP